jgi:hypothetical protein
MNLKWLPWKYVLRKVARAHNVVDPVVLMHNFNKFAKPSEVLAPIELLRNSLVFQARAVLNSQAIQHNLDWIWPYWVEEQFNPVSDSFVPRAFSVTHMNLTHRNWTAVGYPGVRELPIVDPRGMVTPFYDSWSVDVWIVGKGSDTIFPSKSVPHMHRLDYEGNLRVETSFKNGSAQLKEAVEVESEKGIPYCRMHIKAAAEAGSKLIVSVRPFNPEGVSFINSIQVSNDYSEWTVNKKERLVLRDRPDGIVLSNYSRGDFHKRAGGNDYSEESGVSCTVGMATGGAVYTLDSTGREIELRIPYAEIEPAKEGTKHTPAQIWRSHLSGTAQLTTDYGRYAYLYDSALRTVLLHTGYRVYAGPYTYKHFWIRDAVIIGYALLRCGMPHKALSICEEILQYQKSSGYVRSQNGEWDSNGQVLWLLQELADVIGTDKLEKYEKKIKKAARWIIRKKNNGTKDPCTDGIMPAGFSAEHLGPNDNYYWDTFWSIAGLQAAGALTSQLGDDDESRKFKAAATTMTEAVSASLDAVEKKTGSSGMPASPHRRLDSGAVGSLAASYPLRIFDSKDTRVRETVEYLMENCMVDNSLFHDISHSGINPYLTLHMAQALLRNNDSRYRLLVQSIAQLASETGNWPEAAHPTLKTGTMGDGQHVWAAAEWLLMVRNMFVREEGEKLILCSGIPEEWLTDKTPVSFGPTPTKWGSVTVSVIPEENNLTVTWDGVKSPGVDIEVIIGDKVHYGEKDKNQIIFENFYNK